MPRAPSLLMLFQLRFKVSRQEFFTVNTQKKNEEAVTLKPPMSTSCGSSFVLVTIVPVLKQHFLTLSSQSLLYIFHFFFILFPHGTCLLLCRSFSAINPSTYREALYLDIYCIVR